MAYPPVIPPNNRTDATDMVTVHASDHNALADALTAMLPTPWTALPLTAPWVPYGSGYQVPQYRKIGDMVQLRGVANKGANFVQNEVFGTVPAGFTPPAKIQFLALWGSSVMVNLELGTNGQLVVSGWVTLGTYLVLDGIKAWSIV